MINRKVADMKILKALADSKN